MNTTYIIRQITIHKLKDPIAEKKKVDITRLQYSKFYTKFIRRKITIHKPKDSIAEILNTMIIIAAKHLCIGSNVVGKGIVSDIGFHRSYCSWIKGRLLCERAIKVTFSNGDIVSWAGSAKIQVLE